MSKKDEVLKDFEFHIPVELVKSEKEDDDSVDSWKIQGIASTSEEDLQGEIVDQNGLDISLLKAGRGLFNFVHLKGPENVIGQIEDADFVNTGDNSKALFVKGYLFKYSDKGKAFYNILKSLKKGEDAQHRVHFSIEGKILKRAANDPKTIANARIDKVALTFDPVNPVTYCSLVKSLNQMNTELSASQESDVEVVVENDSNVEKAITLSKTTAEKLLALAKKAMAAGAGGADAPTSRVGGAAMSKESLESDVVDVAGEKKKKKKDLSHSQVVKSLIDKARERHPNVDPLELTRMVISSYDDKLLKQGMKKQK